MRPETLQTVGHQIDKNKKTNTKREFNIVMSGKFCTLAMFIIEMNGLFLKELVFIVSHSMVERGE